MQVLVLLTSQQFHLLCFISYLAGRDEKDKNDLILSDCSFDIDSERISSSNRKILNNSTIRLEKNNIAKFAFCSNFAVFQNQKNTKHMFDFECESFKVKKKAIKISTLK